MWVEELEALEKRGQLQLFLDAVSNPVLNRSRRRASTSMEQLPSSSHVRHTQPEGIPRQSKRQQPVDVDRLSTQTKTSGSGGPHPEWRAKIPSRKPRLREQQQTSVISLSTDEQQATLDAIADLDSGLDALVEASPDVDSSSDTDAESSSIVAQLALAGADENDDLISTLNDMDDLLDGLDSDDD